MLMHGYLTVLCLALALGYAVCVLARKEKGTLKTVGYTIGISIMVLALISGLLTSIFMPCGHRGIDKMGKMGKMCEAKRMPHMKK